MMKNLSPLALPFALCACAPSVPSFFTSSPPAMPLMSVDECKAAEICTIRGEVSVFESDGVAMGEVKQSDGKCVTLSLSRNDINYLKKKGLVEATVSGKMYRGHHDPNYLLLKIEGRKVGYPRCGEFYLFVPSGS
jgi:hypothetical protein